MPDEDVEALLSALNTLITSDDAKHLFNSLTGVVNLQIAHPVWFSGEAAVLNPLIPVGKRDPDRFRRLIEKVDDARRKNLAAPLVEPQDGYNKTSYMREFMYEKRKRERRAADIENMLRPEKDRLIGRPRLDFMAGRSKIWHKLLSEKLTAARRNHGGRRLPQELDRAIRAQFWTDVDRQLDEAEEAALATIRKK